MSNNTSHRLAALPAKLRSEIWRLVLILPKQLDLDTDAAIIHERSSLLKTCRQTRAEASSIFYGENQFFASFALGQKDHLIPWLDTVGPEHARHIRHLQVQLGYLKTTDLRLQEARTLYSQSGDSTAAALARCIVERGVPPTNIRATEQSSDTFGAKLLILWTVMRFQEELDGLKEDETL